MEHIWYIIIGLGFDIIGAILIVKPILYFRGVWIQKNVDYFKKHFDDQTPSIEIRNIRMAWIGVALLSVGFAIQIYGNLLEL